MLKMSDLNQGPLGNWLGPVMNTVTFEAHGPTGVLEPCAMKTTTQGCSHGSPGFT